MTLACSQLDLALPLSFLHSSVVSPSNANITPAAHFASMLSPVITGMPAFGGFDSAGALRDPSLTPLSQPNSARHTPMQSPLTPTSFGQPPPSCYSFSGSAGSLSLAGHSSTLLDMLDPSAVGAHALRSLDATDDHDMSDDEEDDQTAHKIDLDAGQTSSVAGTKSTEQEEQLSDSEEDEDYDDQADNASDMDSDASDAAGGLVEWVEQSQRNGAAPSAVLTRLLADYAHLPISPKYLWRVAYNMSLQIQQQMVRESTRRQKLAHVNSLDDVVRLISTSKKIIVLTGAGISVSAGIPDFRSKGGIYPRLKREFGMESPESMFDLEYFRANPQIFYSFARELWPGAHQPTVAHRFISMLEQRGILLRNYTQNIDALESRAGITNVLQCHGSFATAKCMSCERVVHGMDIHQEIMNQQIAKCIECWPQDAEAAEEITEDGPDRSCRTFGVMKPEIVFFGESLPESFRTSLESDRDEADLVIVMGSSLKVQPVAGMLEIFSKNIPMVLINREVVGQPNEFDVEVLGKADDACAYIAHKLNWELPEVDPRWDTFASPTTTTETESDVAAAAAATSTPTPITNTPRAVATSAVACPPSPTFVAPNRYHFTDDAVDLSASPSPSIDCSDAQSCDSVSLPPAMEDCIDTAEATELQDTPSPPPRTPVHASLQSPSRSPRVLAARPPHLQLDTAAGHAAHEHAMADINLVCTPTKTSRFLAHPSSASASPRIKPVPTPTTPKEAALASWTAAAATAAGNKRKTADPTTPTHCLAPAAAVSLCAASTSAAGCGPCPSCCPPGCTYTPSDESNSAAVPHTGIASHLKHQHVATAAAAATSADNFGIVHQPPVKRRKVSVPESKESDEPLC